MTCLDFKQENLSLSLFYIDRLPRSELRRVFTFLKRLRSERRRIRPEQVLLPSFGTRRNCNGCLIVASISCFYSQGRCLRYCSNWTLSSVELTKFLTVKSVGRLIFGIFFKIGVDVKRVRTFGERPVRQSRKVRARGQVVAPALAGKRTQRLHAAVILILIVSACMLMLMLICVVGQFWSRILVRLKWRTPLGGVRWLLDEMREVGKFLLPRRNWRFREMLSCQFFKTRFGNWRIKSRSWFENAPDLSFAVREIKFRFGARIVGLWEARFGKLRRSARGATLFVWGIGPLFAELPKSRSNFGST